MPGKFWESDTVVDQQQPSAPAAPALRPVLSVPDPQGDAADARDQIRTDINVRGEQRQEGQNAFQNVQNLRQEFYKLPQVTNYQTQVQSFAQALQAAPNPNGDQLLITAYAKMLDPASVVREGEYNTVANADSAAGRLWAKLQKEGGFDGAGMLRPKIRENIRREMLNMVDRANAAYNQQRVFYADQAKSAGIDPEAVIGPHAGQPYAEIIQKAFAPQAGTAKTPANADVYGNGVQLAGGGGDGGSFDRDTYLAQQYGIKPGQEQLLVAGWNANRGNQNLDLEGARSIYRNAGMEPPDDDTLKQQIDAAKKGGNFQGIDTTAAEKAHQAALDAAIAARGDDPESMAGTVGLNAAQGITLNGLDELSGVGGFLGAAARGQDPVAAYQGERDIVRREQERSEAAHPVAAPVANLAGSFITAPVGFRGVQTATDAAKAGAALGALGGFNAGEGLADSSAGAAVGGAAGGALGYGGQRAADALAARAAARAAQGPPASEGAQVVAAADRLNQRFGTDIRPIPADVGSPGIRNISGAATKLPLSADPIVKGARRVTDEAEKAKDAIAALAGNATTGEAAGEAALKGAQKFIASSKTKVDALYAKARQLGGAEPVDLANARGVLDRNIAELEQTPGGSPGLAELKSLRAELDKPYPVEGVKAMRTTLRDRFLGDGLRGSDLERRVGQVVDAAEQDVTDSLAAAGKSEAAKAYQAAADAHRERVGVIDNVLAPIIGKNGEKSVEDVMKALDTATKTKGARLGKFLSSLPKSDAGTVRASLISRLGRATAGQQDAEGTAFSLGTFLTHWNQISDTAKAQLFGGELRAALNDLAKVAQGTKEAQRFSNFSNTGGPLGLLASGGVAAGALAHPVAAASFFLSQAAGGRLLASPSFARWLAKMPKNPALVARHIQGLSKIASADSVVAADALGLQQQLTQAFGANPARLAAQPNTETSTTGAETQ